MGKIVISGATGFVGKNLITYLKGSELRALGRSELNNSLSKLFEGCEVFIHLAGKAHDLKGNADYNDYYEVNFELTKKLYDSFLKSGAKKFIFVSSVKAVADTVNGVLTEEYVPSPQTHYGKSKLMAEEYIQSKPLPEGKSYYILRPCMIHGPGNKGNLNLLYKFVEKGLPYPLAAFENRRSFLSVENLCFVITQLIQSNIASGIYNVADDESLSTNEVVDILASSLNKKTILWPIPAPFIKFLAKIGDKVSLPLNTERLNKLTEDYVVSNQKIKDALMVNFPLGTVEGLKITALSFKHI